MWTSCQELGICVFLTITRVSEGTLGLLSSSRDKQVASEQPQQWKQREQLAAS